VTAAYVVEDLVFSYGKHPVLTVEKLEIPPGKIIALVGPNGSGKTTLLHVLAFLLIPHQGRVFFFGDGSTKKNLLPFRRRVGLLLQNPYLFRTSVLANVLSGLKIRGMRGDRARRLALAALDRVGLSGFEHRSAGSLSGGESQRVALARALVLEPDVFLLDEPSNHMDRESIRRTEEIVRELNSEQGKTIILTTHNLAMIEKIVDRVLHLSEGKLCT